MVHVLLFHHVQGLTHGMDAFADALRRDGHTVDLPDLLQGRTFDSVSGGVAFVRENGGFDAVVDRGLEAAAELPPGIVYAGFSMGCLPAQHLAQLRQGAAGVLLFHGFIAPQEFGPWPKGLRAQIHGMDRDPYFTEDDGDLAHARVLAEKEATVELFLYPGDQHLFADSSLTSYDEEATSVMLRRSLSFLASLAP